MTHDPTPEPNDGGFTLIEAVIAMALLLLATVTMYQAFGRSGQEIYAVQGMVEQQADARNALEAISSELRNAFTGVDGMNRIEALSASGITFYTADRGTPITLRKVIYRVNGTAFERSVLASTTTNSSSPYTWTFPLTAATFKPVVNGLTSSAIFVYYDANSAVVDPASANAATNVKLVEITLQVRDASAKTSQKVETYKTTVRLRGVG